MNLIEILLSIQGLSASAMSRALPDLGIESGSQLQKAIYACTDTTGSFYVGRDGKESERVILSITPRN
jgi:hypothetical protein